MFVITLVAIFLLGFCFPSFDENSINKLCFGKCVSTVKIPDHCNCG